MPFHNNNNRLFKSNNVFLKLPHTPCLLHPFNKKETLNNRYTRKQPARFSITPLRPKFKKKKFSKPHNLVCLLNYA